MENEFFTAAANIIIKHLNKEFPKVTRFKDDQVHLPSVKKNM